MPEKLLPIVVVTTSFFSHHITANNYTDTEVGFAVLTSEREFREMVKTARNPAKLEGTRPAPERQKLQLFCLWLHSAHRAARMD